MVLRTDGSQKRNRHSVSEYCGLYWRQEANAALGVDVVAMAWRHLPK
jgi:hypothetical protein